MAFSIVASRAAFSMLRSVRSHHLNTRWIATAGSSRDAEQIDAAELIRSVPVNDVNCLLNSSGHHYLDVRTNEEFGAGHPSGAVNIPYMFKNLTGMSMNPKFLEEVSARFAKNDALLVGCKSGRRSLLAATELHSAGFSRVTNVAGGYSSWVQNGLPTEE